MQAIIPSGVREVGTHEVNDSARQRVGQYAFNPTARGQKDTPRSVFCAGTHSKNDTEIFASSSHTPRISYFSRKLKGFKSAKRGMGDHDQRNVQGIQAAQQFTLQGDFFRFRKDVCFVHQEHARARRRPSR